MAVDLKSELTRPLALILAAFAALGWVLLGLSSMSTASVQRAQRLQIVEMSEKNEKLSTELNRQLQVSGELAKLQTQLVATREDMDRMTQVKADLQQELTGTQRDLQAKRKEMSEVDRNVQVQTQKLTEMQSNAPDGGAPSTTEAPANPRSYGRRSGRNWGWRGRQSRSYSVITRSR